MKLIRATLESEIGIQIHNVKLLVMTEEDAEKLLEIQKADVEVHSAVAMRFDALEEQIVILQAQVRELARAMRSL